MLPTAPLVLAALLSVSPDAAALKARLAANADMNTLAVVGTADKFKIELNVLDPERTSIKIRGPVAPRWEVSTASECIGDIIPDGRRRGARRPLPLPVRRARDRHLPLP